MSARTIQVPEDVYQGLVSIARGNVPKYLTKLVRRNSYSGLDATYAEMASEEVGDRDAKEWSEGLISDAGNEAW